MKWVNVDKYKEYLVEVNTILSSQVRVHKIYVMYIIVV